jgi:hypothetical protein
VSNGQRFLLVSFGRDGRPDRTYDEHMLEAPPEPKENVCFHPDRDTVFRETGPVRYCLK